MNLKQPRITRAKSGGKQLLSPEQQPKTQTSSQNLIAKDHPRPIPSTRLKPETPTKPQEHELLPCQSKEKVRSKKRNSSSSSLEGSEMEREDLLKMEIKQLKRENQFLRKKIQELTQGNQQTQTSKKKTLASKI